MAPRKTNTWDGGMLHVPSDMMVTYCFNLVPNGASVIPMTPYLKKLIQSFRGKDVDAVVLEKGNRLHLTATDHLIHTSDGCRFAAP